MTFILEYCWLYFVTISKKITTSFVLMHYTRPTEDLNFELETETPYQYYIDGIKSMESLSPHRPTALRYTISLSHPNYKYYIYSSLCCRVNIKLTINFFFSKTSFSI